MVMSMINQLKAEIDDLRTKLLDTERQAQSAWAAANSSEAKLYDLQAQIVEAKHLQSLAENRVSDLQTDNANLRSLVGQLQARIADLTHKANRKHSEAELYQMIADESRLAQLHEGRNNKALGYIANRIANACHSDFVGTVLEDIKRILED